MKIGTTLFKKILILITVVLILSLTVAMSINFYMAKNHYDKNLDDEMLFLSAYYKKELNKCIKNKIKNLENILNSREFDVYGYTLQDKLIKELFKNYSNIFPNIYFLTQQNTIVTYDESTEESFLAKSTELDLEILKENPNEILVSDIHYNELLKKPVITFSILKRNYFNEDIGIIFAIVPIDNFVNKYHIKLKKHFTIRIVDKNRYIASSSKSGEVMTKLQIDNNLQQEGKFHAKVMEEDSCSYLIKANYGDIIISYPHKKFHELVNSYILINLLIYGVIIIIAFIITFIFSRSLTNPLKLLLDKISEYSQGNFDKKIELNTNDEIAVVTNSFNQLGKELADKRAELLDINKNLEIKIANEVKKNIEKEHLLMKKSKLASMAELMDAVAHQWKQPLSVISITSSNLKLQNELTGKLSTELINKIADSIDLQVSHLVETIDEFRKFFRPNENKERVSLKKLVKSVLEINSNLLISNQIKTVVNVDKEIKYDILQAEFKHVFINFISNAKDAFIENKIVDRKLIFSACENESNIVITVTDNAGGISEGIINTIFDANITTKENTQGTGIGLYMSKQIVEKLNGIITVENIEFNTNENKQKGAKFKIILPKI